MSTETIIPVGKLRKLLDYLKEKEYVEGTQDNYRRKIAALEKYMVNNGIDAYSPEVGMRFKRYCFSTSHIEKDDCGFVATVTRKLDNYCYSQSFEPSLKHSKIPLPENYERLLESYLDSCCKRGIKPPTITKKSSFCRSFFEDLIRINCKEIQCLNFSHIFKACLKIDNKDRYGVIRDLLNYLNQASYIDADYSTLIPRYKREFKIPITYSEAEIRKFEEAIDRSTSTGKRNYALLLLATRLGMRSGDIAKLSLCEVDFGGNRINIVQEKTGEPLELPLLPEIKGALEDYILHARPDSTGDSVFLRSNAPHQQITTSVIRFATAKYFGKAGINVSGKKHGPHTFRSSLASSMVNDDVPYEAVRSILGHSGSQAVKHYAKLDIERLREYSIEIPEPTGKFKAFLEGVTVR